MIDEDGIGSESPDGGTDIVARVAVGGKRNYTRTITAKAIPGSAIRLTLHFGGLKHSARILAFVDPMTGKAVIRMGMLERKGGKVSEADQQIVWDSDGPIYSIK